MDYKKAESFLLKATQLGLALVLFVPLFVLGGFGITPYDESSKVLIFQTLVEIVFFIYLCLILFDKNYLPRKSRLLFLVALFYLFEIISSVLGINFFRSFFGNLSRMDGIVFHLHLLAFFTALVSVLREKADWMRFFKIAAAVSAIESLAALSQVFGFARFYSAENSRIFGTFVNPGIFGNYIALCVFLATFLFFEEKNKNLKALYLGLAGLNCVALFLSGTRGAWAGTAAGIFLFVFLAVQSRLVSFWRKPESRGSCTDSGFRVKPGMTLSIILVLIFFVFAFWQISKAYPDNFFVQRTWSVFNIDYARKNYWQESLTAFIKRPALGWGADSFNFVWEKYGSYEDTYELSADKPHNKFVEILVSGGLAGIFAYGLIIGWIFYLIFRKGEFSDKRAMLSLAGFFTCYLVENFFLFDSAPSYTLFFLAAGYVSGFGQKNEAVALKPQNLGAKIALIPLAVFFMAAVFYYLNAKPALAGMYFAAGRATEFIPGAAVEMYQKALKTSSIYNNDYNISVINRLVAMLESGQAETAQEQVFTLFSVMQPWLAKYEVSKNQQEKILHLHTARIYEKLYVFSGKQENLAKAEKAANYGISFSAAPQDFYLEIARISILQANSEQADLYAGKFSETAGSRSFKEQKKYFNLASAYFDAGQKERGFENAEKALQISGILKKSNQYFMNLGQFFNFTAGEYKKAGQTEKAKKIYRECLKIYPEYAGFWNARLSQLEELR